MIKTALIGEGTTAADDVLCRWSSAFDNFTGARRRSLLGRALLRKLLVDATRLSAAGWTFDKEPSGRLIARHRDCGRCPSVSLSHSGGWVACAITDAGAIGVDIEAHTSGRDFSGIAGAVFGPDEQRQVAAHGAAGFYRVWTLKEAMAKASGGGIVEVADRTDRVAKDPKEGFWRADIGITSWWLAHAQMSGLSMSLAIREA